MALKAIANAFTGDDDEEIVDRFVDMGGLKYIFAILLRKGLKSGDVDEQKIIYENCLNVIYALMRGANGITKIRVERKLA